jgi:hypothetical protein
MSLLRTELKINYTSRLDVFTIHITALLVKAGHSLGQLIREVRLCHDEIAKFVRQSVCLKK